MHILYLHQYFCPPDGGGNTRSLDFALAWQAAGHHVTILTSSAYFPEAAQNVPGNRNYQLDSRIEVHVLDVPYSHMMPFGERIRAFLRFYRKAKAYAKKALTPPDVIYASSTPPTVGELGMRLAAHWGIPFVFETVDVWPDVPEGMGVIRNRFLLRWLHHRVRRIYSAADAIVTLSEGMEAQVLSSGIDAAKVHVVHNGTDPSQFKFALRPTRLPVTAIYTGTVGQANGVEAIVDAAVRIHALGHTDISFVIVGSGNALEAVKAYARSKEVPNLRFMPAVPKSEVPGMLASADIGLVTFAPFQVLEANSANKWYDYLASGLPVVTNYQGWQKQWMDSFDCGLSARQGDLEAFVSNILTLAADAPLRARMGRNGREMVEQHFDRKALAGRVLALLQSAVK